MKYLKWILGLAALYIVVSALTPVPSPSDRNTYVHIGVVQGIFSPCCEDIVVKLKGITKDYFINRGLEQGISIDNWKNNLLGEKIELTLIKHHWSILNPTGRLTSIARLKSGDDYLFDRM